MEWVYGLIALWLIGRFIKFLNRRKSEREWRKMVSEEPISKEPIEIEKPKVIAFESLAKEYAENPLAFVQRWSGKTFVVRGSVHEFTTTYFIDDRYVNLSKSYHGNCIVMDITHDGYGNGFYAAASFAFPPYSSTINYVKVGDNVEVEGTLAGHMASSKILAFTDCSIQSINGNTTYI